MYNDRFKKSVTAGESFLENFQASDWTDSNSKEPPPWATESIPLDSLDCSETTTGERGESGENPINTRVSEGRKKGELGRISPLEGDFLSEPIDFDPPDYPISALGPLSDLVTEIATEGQLEPAMAGQWILSVAALLAQSRANVRTLAGIKPLSLCCLTIGESGDGKSTSEFAALAPVENYQRVQSLKYQDEMKEYDQACSEKKKGPKPERPRLPYLIVKDGTVEGIRRSFDEGAPSQGVFTSEGATMLHGWGMSRDNRQKTASEFNSLWDSGTISVSRALSGRFQLYDRRLSIHWLIQPEAASESIQDASLSSLGFWPRFFGGLAKTESATGYTKFRARQKQGNCRLLEGL